MGQSLVAVHAHIVFSTKDRVGWIEKAWRDELFAYMGGVINGGLGTPIASGGVEDHVHLLTTLSSTVPISTLLRDVKAASSRWIHDRFPRLRDFAWQNGYAAFSVSESNLEMVRRYLASQEEHHRARSFKEELLELLREHRVEFDERYLWM